MGEPTKWSALRSWRSVELNPLRRLSRGEPRLTRQVRDSPLTEKPAHSGTTSENAQTGPHPTDEAQCSIKEDDDEYTGADPHGEEAEDSAASQFEFRTEKVTHPWGVVDFHLYLNVIDGGRRLAERRNGMFVLDRASINPVVYHAITIPELLESGTVNGDRKLIYECFPVPESGSSFNGACYIVGLDSTSERLFARRFSFTPDDMEELAERWSEGIATYKFSIEELYEVMKRSLGDEEEEVLFPDLASSDFCTIPGGREEPAMEMVILLRCSQFVVDISEMSLLEDYGEAFANLGFEMSKFVSDWRFILEQASSQSWIAARHGVSRNEFTTQSSGDRTAYDLYTIGRRGREDEEPSTERVEADEEQCADLSTEYISHTPRQEDFDHSNDMGRSVPHIDIPFSAMLEGLADLARDYPEVDTENNRRRLGELLMDIQISLDRQQRESEDEG